VYVVTPRDVERLRPPGQAAFQWGSAAPAAHVDLAYALLRHTTRREPPKHVVAQLHAEVVASLPHPGFVLGCDDIALWLADERRDPQSWPPAVAGT
jgi:hypothetical protein